METGPGQGEYWGQGEGMCRCSAAPVSLSCSSPEEQERQREEWKQDLARVSTEGRVKGCVGLFGSEAHLDDCFSVV